MTADVIDMKKAKKRLSVSVPISGTKKPLDVRKEIGRAMSKIVDAISSNLKFEVECVMVDWVDDGKGGRTYSMNIDGNWAPGYEHRGSDD